MRQEKHGAAERVEVDLSNVPVKPASRREIQQLETALVIGTLYRPEVVELIRDPLERATWVDSLAVAAAALAREKFGMPASRIADEIGRSETMVRAHLQGKTKAGKLVRETYEKLARGELKLAVPFGGVQLTLDEYERLKRAEERMKELEEQVGELRRRLEECVPQERVRELEGMLRDLERENSDLRAKLSELNKVVEELRRDLEKRDSVIAKVKELLGCP